jgi:hypothetical protein
MFNCGKGKHRFSETGYCDLFGKHGSFKEYKPMCKLAVMVYQLKCWLAGFRKQIVVD